MKKNSFILVAICLQTICGCGKEIRENAMEPLSIPAGVGFDRQSYTLMLRDTAAVGVHLLNHQGRFVPYDLSQNKKGYLLSSDNKSVASIDQQGHLVANALGRASISIKSKDGTLRANATIEVTCDSQSTTGIIKPLSEKLIYSKNARIRTTSAVMQSFDVDTAGNLYYAQLNRKYRAYVSYGAPGSKYTQVMTLNYFGHVSNFTVEQAGDDRYIWVDNYSSKNSKGDYWGSPVISRVKFENGKTVNSWETTDNYYCGISNISVAVDVAHDMLTILGISTGDVITYRLSDARRLSEKTIPVHVVYGGESNNVDDAMEHDTTFNVIARDLRQLTPIGQFVSERIGDVSWQGFEINNGIFYQAEGNANDNDGKTASVAYLTVRDISGNVLEKRTSIAAISDMDALNEYGITDTGSMEAEGVKVRNGQLFIGFCSKGSDDVRTATVFKYRPVRRR